MFEQEQGVGESQANQLSYLYLSLFKLFDSFNNKVDAAKILGIIRWRR